MMSDETQELPVDEEEAQEASAEPKAERRASHLGFVAHEIRNPLSTALWTAELLGRMDAAERGGARGEKLAGMCLRSLQRVRHLVEDHLLIERLDAGFYPVRPEPVNLVDALVAAVGRRAGEEKPPELAVSPELVALADRPLFARLVDALLDAVAQGASSVGVAASSRDGELTLTLRGTPIDPRALEDPLKGAPADTRGRALALPAVRRAAMAMGGSLEVAAGGLALTLPEAAPGSADEG
jgi:signal transduction histidine kinase